MWTQQEVLILIALRGNLDVVLDAVGPGFAGVVGGSPQGTLLHHAAWMGSSEAVRALLARGADPGARSCSEYDTPLAWAAHGSEHQERFGGDHVAVAEARWSGRAR